MSLDVSPVKRSDSDHSFFDTSRKLCLVIVAFPEYLHLYFFWTFLQKGLPESEFYDHLMYKHCSEIINNLDLSEE